MCIRSISIVWLLWIMTYEHPRASFCLDVFLLGIYQWVGLLGLMVTFFFLHIHFHFRTWYISHKRSQVCLPCHTMSFLHLEYPTEPSICVCTMCVCKVTRHVWLFATSGTEAHQAPLSLGFSRQEYWSGLPCPPPGDLPDPETEPASLHRLYCRLILYHWVTREDQPST